MPLLDDNKQIVLSTLFYQLGYIFEDYYRDTEYWQKASVHRTADG